MRARTTAIALVALSLGLVGAAGCGGDSVSEQTTAPTTAATAPAPAPPATSSTPSTAAAPAPAAQLGEDNLPPRNAVPGVHAGDSRSIETAQEFVDILYQAGDAAKPAAVRRLEDGGYSAGILRDQVGTDPAVGLALLRSYAIHLRDADAARKEVSDAVEEVRKSTAASTKDIDVSDIPGAEALRVDVNAGGSTGSVVFVTFPAGSDVYGIQGVATNGAAIPQAEILAAARDLAAKAGATP